MQEEAVQPTENALNQEAPVQEVESQASEDTEQNSEQEQQQTEQQSSTDDDLPKFKERLGKEKHKREKIEREVAILRAQMAGMQHNPNYAGYLPQQYGQPQAPMPTQGQPEVTPVQKEVMQTLEILMNHKQQQTQAQIAAARELKFETAMTKAAEVYEDFEDVVRDPGLPLPRDVLNNVKRFANAPDLLYRLGKNRDELSRIAGLHPDEQLDALTDMAATLKVSGKKAGSKAPEPLTPVKPTPGQNPNAKNPANKSVDQIRAELRKSSWSRRG